MTTIVVGGADCPVSKLVDALQNSNSFHLLQEEWPNIAYGLDTPSLLIQKLRLGLLHDKINLVVLLGELFEDWVGRKRNNATLQVFLKVLRDNGKNAIAESLEKVFSHCINPPMKKYCRLPAQLENFISQKRNPGFGMIILSLDVSITCERIQEHQEGFHIYEYEELLRIISSQDGRKDIIYYVKVQDTKHLMDLMLDEIKKKSKKRHWLVMVIQKAIEHDLTVLFVTYPSFKKEIMISVDEINWDELTLAHKHKIKNGLHESFELEFSEEELVRNMKGKMLIDLINGHQLKLFEDTLHKKLSYYVDRRLSTRHFISYKILDEPSSDMFLFTGVKQYELCGLVKEKGTDYSSNQLRKKNFTVNHIILDQLSHFDEICQRTGEPVHLLGFDKQRFIWVRSKGDLKSIQRHVEKTQDELTEQDFCERLPSNSNQPICISDTPGMGKSVLLAELGRRFQKNCQDRLVVFYDFPKFIKLIKRQGRKPSQEIVQKILQEIICLIFLGEKGLQNMLNSKATVSIELLLDGFDELPDPDMELALEVFNITIPIISIRLWATTRPHLLGKLETTFDTLGYNILPFIERDQVNFLTRYWSRDNQNLNNLKLEKFAVECLSVLKSSMTTKDHDIAGVPLQCFLLGEVYQNNAEESAIANTCHSSITSIPPNSVTNLYKSLFVNKLQKYFSTHVKNDFYGSETMMDMHIKLSLQLLFPDYIDQLDRLLAHVNMEEVLKVGILESSSTSSSPTFIHRTIAEYLVAWFVVDRLGDNEAWSENLASFLLNIALLRTEDNKFAEYVIAYFFNSLIVERQVIPEALQNFLTNESVNPADAILQISRACAYADFLNIFDFFDEMKAFEANSGTIFTKSFLLIVVEHSSLELLNPVMTHFELYNTFDLGLQVTVLHSAVKRGTFSIVEFFINVRGLRTLVEELHSGVKDLLHSCVADSIKQSPAEIEQKIEVIRLIVHINRVLLEEKDKIDHTPLLARNVHIVLLTELIWLGANVFAHDNSKRTVMHVSRFSRILHQSVYSSDEFHSILTSIPDVSLNVLVKEEDLDKHTPLISCLKCIDPLPKTIAALKHLRADFNSVDESGYPALAVVIICGRNATTIKNLVLNGANVDWTEKNGNTLFHLAAARGTAEILQVLEEQLVKTPGVNDDEDGLGDGCVANFRTDKKRMLPTNIREVINSNGQTLLQTAAVMGNLETCRYIIDRGCDVNKIDREGNTALYYAAGMGHDLRFFQTHYYMPPRNTFKRDHESVAILLLENNANPNVTNNQGETPYLRNNIINYVVKKLLNFVST